MKGLGFIFLPKRPGFLGLSFLTMLSLSKDSHRVFRQINIHHGSVGSTSSLGAIHTQINTKAALIEEESSERTRKAVMLLYSVLIRLFVLKRCLTI